LGYQSRRGFQSLKRQWLASLQLHHIPQDAPVPPLKSLLADQVMPDPLCPQSSLQPDHN
jgi:hypothetical protein